MFIYKEFFKNAKKHKVSENWLPFKSLFSGLRQFLTIESPLKMMKDAFISW